MAKVSLNNIGSAYGSIGALNANFDEIETAFERTLSRDGTGPNFMEADLDMNNNEVLNASVLRTSRLFMDGREVEPSDLVWSAAITRAFEFVAVGGETSYNVSPLEPLIENIEIHVNGLVLPPSDVSVLGSVISFPALTAADVVVIKVFLREIGAGAELASFNFIQDKAGAVTRSALDKMRDSFHVKDFGAIGDGVTDDTTALQNAINGAAGFILEFEAGATYKISSELTITSPVHIKGNGATINGSLIPAGTSLNQKRALHAYGSIAGSGIAATASLVQGQTAVSVTNTGTFTKGDLVLVSNDEAMVPGYGNPGSKKGYLSFVEAITDLTTLELSTGALTAMDHTQNLVVTKITPLYNVSIEDLNIQMGGVYSVHGGIKLDYCVNFSVSNVEIRGGEDHGLATWYCYGGKVDQCRVYDSTSAGVWNPPLQTGYSYVFYNASRNITLSNSASFNARRGCTGGNQYPAIFITCENCHAENGFNAWGVHEPCFYWTIRDCTATGITGTFITIRGSNLVITGNKCVGSVDDGIRVRTYYDDPTGLHDIHITDNILESCGGASIWIDGIDPVNDSPSNGGPVNNVVIRGGSIINAGADAIYITRGNNILIDGVQINGVQDEFATDGNGIYINGGVNLWDRSSNITIRNCSIKRMKRNGIRADYVTNLFVDNCEIREFDGNTTGENGVFISDSSDISFRDCRIDMSTGYYPMWLQNVNNVEIDGCVLIGGSGLVSQDLLFIDHTSGASGSRCTNIKVSNTQLRESSRYGSLLRYCEDLLLTGIYSADSGTLNFSNCGRITVVSSSLTCQAAQIYNLRFEDCTRITIGQNTFLPEVDGFGGIYSFRTSGKTEMATISQNNFGAIATGTGIILQDVNYPIITENNFVSIVGGNKVSIIGDIHRIVTNNIPGSVGLWKVDVTGTTANVVGGNNYVITNAAKTTLTLPSFMSTQTRIQFTVANGRSDNEIAYNGYAIEGSTTNYVLNSPTAVVEFEAIGGSTGLKVIGGVA